MHTVLLSKADEVYLEKCAQEHSFSYGIIIGHVSKRRTTFRAPPRRFILLMENIYPALCDIAASRSDQKYCCTSGPKQ